jgi:GGDEF domain-containing protein
MSAPDTVFLLVLAVILALGLCAQCLQRRQQQRELLVGRPRVRPLASATLETPTAAHRAAQRICVAFHGWLAEGHDGPDVWASFDQLVREALSTHLGATRVRCYHVQPRCDALQTIHQMGKSPPPPGPGMREGLLGHVATTGQEYVGDDPAHGPLLDKLAAGSQDRWSWLWPVRQPCRKRQSAAIKAPAPFFAAETIGLIAVGPLGDPAILTAELRQTIGPLLSLCWQHVASLQRLERVQRTDQASGVLTRSDFFAVAEAALRDSYSANEPVVVGVLALEGLRRLDDTGCWGERDALIERLGQQVARGTRSDDVVGRFADDRFLILLRRLDTGLGRLIAEKILETSSQGLGPGDQRLRMGLAGSGLAQPTLPALLGAAFDAVERARKQDVRLEIGDCGLETEHRAPAAPSASFAGEDQSPRPNRQAPSANPQPALPEAS